MMQSFSPNKVAHILMSSEHHSTVHYKIQFITLCSGVLPNVYTEFSVPLGEHEANMETSAQGSIVKTEINSEEEVEANASECLVFLSDGDHAEPAASKAPAGEKLEDTEEEESPPVRRRGQKKAKPPSSLLCVECGQCFGLVSELVTHRKTAHGLLDAIHRCTVCGEGFINTTLYLYHRKQHRAQIQEEQREPPPPVPQLNTSLLEAPGEGLLLLATAGEGQSLLEITSLEQAVPEGVPVAHVEVELDPESGRVVCEESIETVVEDSGHMEVEGIVNMELDKVEVEEKDDGEESKLENEVVEENQVKLDADKHEENSSVAPSSKSAEGQNFLCSQCGSSFKFENELARHRNTEHGMSGAIHTCDVCGVEFMNTTQFLYHRREHRSNMPEELQSSPARQGLSQIFNCPTKHRDIILLRRSGRSPLYIKQLLLIFTSFKLGMFCTLPNTLVN